MEAMFVRRSVPRCRICGDLDVVVVGNGTVDCRTCGIVPKSQYPTTGQAVSRLALRSVLVTVGALAVDVVIMMVSGVGYSFVVIVSGFVVLVFGGIKGGLPLHGGVTTLRAELDARFSGGGEDLTAVLMGGGLLLIGISVLIYSAIGMQTFP